MQFYITFCSSHLEEFIKKYKINFSNFEKIDDRCEYICGVYGCEEDAIIVYRANSKESEDNIICH